VKPPWDNDEKNASVRPGGPDEAHVGEPRIARRFTVGLSRASQLAAMVTRSRAARHVEVADMLVGIYIYEWDRLSTFWENHQRVESFLQRICSISPQRWHHWIELYDKQRHQEEAELSSPWRRLMHRARSTPTGGNGEEDLPRSSELEQVLLSASEISPFRDTVDGRAIPVVTSECVLLCIACQGESEIGRNLCDTGLDVSALERAARDPRRAPHR
jgi:hypothetical protein